MTQYHTPFQTNHTAQTVNSQPAATLSTVLFHFAHPRFRNCDFHFILSYHFLNIGIDIIWPYPYFKEITYIVRSPGATSMLSVRHHLVALLACLWATSLVAGQQDSQFTDEPLTTNGSTSIGDAYYATPTGAGTTDGSDWDNAFAGLADAFTSMPPGGTHTLYLGDGTYTDRFALGSSVNGSTISVQPINGPGTVCWEFAGTNTLSTVVIGDGADSFSIRFADMDILRHNSTGNCYFVLGSNGQGGDKSFIFENVTLDHERHVISQSAGSSPECTISVEFNNCTLRHGYSLIREDANTYLGAIKFKNCVISKSTGPSAGPQGSLFQLAGANYGIASWVMEGCEVYHDGTNLSSKILDLSYRCNNVFVTHCNFYYQSAGYTGPAPCMYIACSGNLDFSSNGVYEQTDSGDRGYTGSYDWCTLFGRGTTTIRDNIFSAIASTSSQTNSHALRVRTTSTTHAVIEGNTIVSGAGGIYVQLVEGNGATVSLTNNELTCDNSNANAEPTGVRFGKTSDESASLKFGAVTIACNTVRNIGPGMGACMFVGRDVGAAGTMISGNTLIGLPRDAQLGTQYGFYSESYGGVFRYNKVFARSAFATIGMQNSVVEYNTFCYDRHGGSKGMISFTQHASNDPQPTHGNIIRFNVVDCAGIEPGSAEIYAEANVSNNSVLSDFNWFAVPDGDAVGKMLGVAYSTTVEQLADDWEFVVEPDPSWSDVTGNDRHSFQSLDGVIADPANGDFRPTQNVNGWGALPYLADTDDDGDADLHDYAMLAACVDRPATGNCAREDFNNDDVIDQADLTLFFRNLTGPR